MAQPKPYSILIDRGYLVECIEMKIKSCERAINTRGNAEINEILERQVNDLRGAINTITELKK